MTDNKRVSNKQILDKINDLKVGEEGLNLLAIKIVSRMVKLKSMETWFEHVSKSDIAWSTAYKDLELTEEEDALGEAAKLMTLMNMFKEDEEYEKCAIIKQRMDEVNMIPAYCETCGQDVPLEDQCIFVGMPTELINKYSQTKNES